jgi:hypothetical protein
MVWKGIIIEESLDNKSILKLIKIIKASKATLENENGRGFLTFDYFELSNNNKEEFLRLAVSSIKDKFYLHICSDGEMIVIYKNKIFEFSSKTIKKLNQARDYGLSVGILKEQMPFENLINNPWD